MKALIQFLQDSPLIILVMFIITALSGIITIILGWNRFCDDILLKKITIPVYAYLIIFFIAALVVIFGPTIKDRPKKLRTIKGESFGVQRIIVDGKHFVNCEFRKTELVFRGEAGVNLEGCSFINVGFTFDGPAQNTVKILMSLYAVPQLRPLIENTFKAIKEGKEAVDAWKDAGLEVKKLFDKDK